MKHFDERDRESVLRDLESLDEEVRRLAVERIEALSASDVVPILVDRIGDHSWRVRKAAVERLVAWPDTDAAASALIAALGDGENPGRRNAAVDALIHHGSSVIPHLITAVEDEDADVRKFVLDAMAGIGDDRTVHHTAFAKSDLLAVDIAIDRAVNLDVATRVQAARDRQI